MRMDGESLAAYWVGLTFLKPLSPDRTGFYFLTCLDAKCVINTSVVQGLVLFCPFLVPKLDSSDVQESTVHMKPPR